MRRVKNLFSPVIKAAKTVSIISSQTLYHIKWPNININKDFPSCITQTVNLLTVNEFTHLSLPSMIAWYGLMGRGPSPGLILPKFRTGWVGPDLKNPSSRLKAADGEGSEFLLSFDSPKYGGISHWLQCRCGWCFKSDSAFCRPNLFSIQTKVNEVKESGHLVYYCQACVLPSWGKSWGTCVRMNSTTMDWTLTSLKTAVPLNPDASMSFDLKKNVPDQLNWKNKRLVNTSQQSRGRLCLFCSIDGQHRLMYGTD